MKKYLSVFGLFVKCSFGRLAAVFLLMLAVQGGFLFYTLQNALSAAEVGVPMAALSSALFWRVPAVLFGIAFLAAAVFLCLPGCGFGSAVGCTLRRLLISENRVRLCQIVYNFCVLLFFWALEVLLVFGFSFLYVSAAPPEVIGSHTVLLSFYQNDFLHSLLPLHDMAGWIGNLLFAVILAESLAQFPYMQRRGKFEISAILSVAYTLLTFVRGIGDTMRLSINAVILLMVLFSVLRAEFMDTESAEIETEEPEEATKEEEQDA